MTLTVRSLLLGLLFFQWLFAELASGTLWKRYVSNTEAVCNDNSRATFYILRQSSYKWIVFFESGGFCASFEECNKRYMNKNSTVLMTSALLPDKVTGRDVLSASKSENPTFYDYTHVLVPYCSSDLWLGSKTNPQKPFHFVNDSSVDNFSFRGHTIFRSVFQDLLQRYNLSKAEEIILSGSSAGGIGVLNHADWVLNHVINSRGLNATMKTVVDSGWFLNFQDSLKARVRPEFLSFANISSLACKDMSRGYTCCPSASCMIAHGYYPTRVPLILISSLYDIFMFGDALRRLEGKGKTVVENSADYLSLASMYGGAMNESLAIFNNEGTNLSVIAPACFQHIFLSTSSLWDDGGVLPSTVEIVRGRGMFSHRIESGNWELAKIQNGTHSISIKEFIATWIKSHGTPMKLIDSCLGARCNPTCPDQLLFKDPATKWGQTAQIIILVLSLAVTVVSCGIKVSFFLHHFYLKRKQEQYLSEEHPLTEKELPPCKPHERISIACLCLSYSVGVRKQGTTKDKINSGVPLNEKANHDKPTAKFNSVPNGQCDNYVHLGNTEDSWIPEEDSNCDSQCSNEEKCRERSQSLSAVYLGFNSEADEELVPALDNGLVYDAAFSEKHSNLKRESGSDFGNEKRAKPSSGSVDNFGFDQEEPVTALNDEVVSGSACLGNHSQLEAKGGVGLIQFANGINSSETTRKNWSNHKRKGQETDYLKKVKSPRTKEILKDVSAYFNPGELIAIMGPSGCGKTTLLDLLTGRRRHGDSKGQVYINGVGLDRVQDWFARKIGYMLQLAVPYYEELTVRQNLFFAAHMRLSKKMSHSRKFERVEQILAETGLTSMADVVVGGSIGGGLSGGQKRRLCVALQMINMPSVLFLDEPTSGLDASSSLELLNHLNLVAESGRLVLLTIHQPRLEIFHLFHKILLLCDGQVAYYGEPTMAPAVFLEAYIQSTNGEFHQSKEAPKIDVKNPADAIMDLLNGPRSRRDSILSYYQTSGEPQAVQEAIRTSQKQASNRVTIPRKKQKYDDGAGAFNRIFVLEARTSARQTLGQIFYFPLIFFTFGVIVGTVYWQAEEKDGNLLMSAYGVYCCASPLFLSSVLMAHFNKALDILHLERADGCGRSHENVIQTYVRTAALCVLPVIVCSVMSYFMVMTSYDLWKLLLVTIISLVLNQTWIAVYMMVICAQPRIAHRICQMLSAIGGFAGGFLVPRPSMPAGYNIFFYINPLFYGFSGITKVLLKDARLKCTYDSTLNCISTDGNAVLTKFGFDTVNIYENLVVMLGMTVLTLIMSWVFLEVKHVNTNFSRKSSTPSKEEGVFETSIAQSLHKAASADIEAARRKSTLGIITEDKGLHTVEIPDTEDVALKQESEPKLLRRRSSRKERWQSTRRRVEERRTSIETQIKNVEKAVRRSLKKAEQHSKEGEQNGKLETKIRMRTVSFEHERGADCEFVAVDVAVKERVKHTSHSVQETRF